MGMTFKKAPRFIRWCFFVFLLFFLRLCFRCAVTPHRGQNHLPDAILTVTTTFACNNCEIIQPLYENPATNFGIDQFWSKTDRLVID